MPNFGLPKGGGCDIKEYTKGAWKEGEYLS